MARRVPYCWAWSSETVGGLKTRVCRHRAHALGHTESCALFNDSAPYFCPPGLRWCPKVVAINKTTDQIPFPEQQLNSRHIMCFSAATLPSPPQAPPLCALRWAVCLPG